MVIVTWVTTVLVLVRGGDTWRLWSLRCGGGSLN
ncbi:hypothetical protein TIFTF001_055762 [Ficus carica]|uniref:Uncharacterized protein n=1 Tax=Ficus carica TaxID=3494 RepID=A0AA88EIH9_FICCA|nr:hypothetical protein TIFTF001_055762 [Ficus carica]